MEKVRIRFAPSPTGYLHIGSLRTVLFDYLIAKTLPGVLILRIEDTDQKREVIGAVESLINILDWVGIKFDEGPHVGGEYGPYTQSQRLDIYKKYAQDLLDAGKAYRCFCTAERLKLMREEQQSKKMPPRYDRTCRELSTAEIKNKLDQVTPFVIRQKMPLTGVIIVDDELRGKIKFNAVDLDDHVLMKSDGVPTYQLAVVVDDHLMEISHVVRGEEWISSFPKNILLYEDFGWTPPKFIHMTLTLNKGGGKLSKRQGDVAVEDYRAKGYLPEAILNFCVLLGWHPKDDNEILSLEEMIEKFDYKDLGTNPAIFDIEKLDYFNGWYIRHKTINELAEICLPFLVQAGIIEKIQNVNLKMQNDNLKIKNILSDEEITFGYIKKVLALEQERLKKLSEIGELTGFFFEPELKYEPKLLVWKKMELTEVRENLIILTQLLDKVPADEWTHHSIKEAISSYLEAKNLKVGNFLWPMRVALTGRQASPGPFEVAEVLGKEKTRARLQTAIKNCKILISVS